MLEVEVAEPYRQEAQMKKKVLVLRHLASKEIVP
jgi:hypothetical protein